MSELRRRLDNSDQAAWLEVIGALRAEAGNVVRSAARLSVPERTFQNWRNDVEHLELIIAAIRDAAGRASLAAVWAAAVPEPWASSSSGPREPTE